MANIDTPDFAAMSAFEANIRQMTDSEITAAVNWMWDRAKWEIEHRKRWPWWDARRTTESAAPA